MRLTELNLVLTTAGINAMTAAKAAEQKLAVTSVVFGNSTGTPGAGTTSVGTVLQTSELFAQGTNLANTSFSIQALFEGFSGATSGMLGVYVGSTLLGACKHTMLDSSEGAQQVVMHATNANSSVISKSPSTAPAGIIGDLFLSTMLASYDYIGNGRATGDKILMGTASGDNAHIEPCQFIYISQTPANLPMDVPNGHTTWVISTDRLYTFNSGVWTQNSSKLSDFIIPGLFYSDRYGMNLYFAFSKTDIILVRTPTP